jgi:hypothetical protein
VFAEKRINFAVGGLTLRAVPPSPDDIGVGAEVASLPLPAPSRVA